MASNNDKYSQFHQALILSPEYLGIASKSRKDCSEFVHLATQLDKEPPPDADTVEAAYVAAVDEAHKLVAKGLLTVALPNEELATTIATDSAATAVPVSHHKFEIHPTAAIFPMMPDAALNELAADIKENGLQSPIVMHDGKVIDGRNRLEGCHRAGVQPAFAEWSGTGSVVAWIISVNVHRRHLTDQQRAMIAAKVAQELTAEAKGRSAQNLRNSGAPVDESNLPHRAEGRSTEQAASLLNVSASAAKKATKIAKSASEELVKAVTDGKVSLDAAAQVSTLSKKKQRKLVEKGQVQEAAKKIRKDKATEKGKAEMAAEPEPLPLPATVGAKTTHDTMPAPNGETETATDAELQTDAPSEPATNDVSIEVPFLREAHEAIDQMTTAARCAQRMEYLEKALRGLITACDKFTAKCEESMAP